ncbi:MAG: glycosyltransferase family 2 protein [Desulfobacteraceae bacterium]|nr:MAG: glycosyltransferase family 2 protein [Desulfobacteraceae bacterium]
MPTAEHIPAATLSDPPVSVVLTTFNRASMVRQAIDSVLAQTYPGFELIVVDDGSSDDTPALLNRYGDRIRVLRCNHRGVSAARNCGIRAAAGGLIALLDSDDYWLPEKLARQVEVFASHPDLMIGQTEEIWLRNGVRVNPRRRHKKLAGLIFEPSLTLCLISPSAVMLRKAVLDEVGLFDENLPACEDYDLWLRITWKHPVHLIPEALIVKRGGHPDQLSRMSELDKYRIQAIVKILAKGCLSAAQRSAALAMLAEKCRIYAAGCRKRGRLEEADYYASLIPAH